MNVKKFGAGANIIWSDRKRIMGMPISFTRYYIVELPGRWRKLFEVTGFLSTKTEEVQLFRVDDFTVKQSLGDKAYKVGDITVYFKDASHDTMTIQKVKNVYKVYDILNEEVEKDRRERRMSYGEFQR